MPIEQAQTLNESQFEFETHTTFSNVFERTFGTQTQPELDMEIWRTSFNFSYGIKEYLDLRIEIPFITNSGGFLDSFIQGYHNTFGFPNGGRHLVSNNQFTYKLTQNGQTVFDYNSSGFGISDTTLRIKYLITDHLLLYLPIDIAILGYLKLPTGKATKGLSSGHVDFGSQVIVQKDFTRWHFYSQLGISIITGHDSLNSLLKNYSIFFGQGVEFQITDYMSANLQLTGNTSIFKNIDSRDLSDPILDLVVGISGAIPLNHKILDEFFYQFSFSEDILAHGPSVDFSTLFLIGVRY